MEAQARDICYFRILGAKTQAFLLCAVFVLFFSATYPESMRH